MKNQVGLVNQEGKEGVKSVLYRSDKWRTHGHTPEPSTGVARRCVHHR